jgi:hypothetical protein
MQDHVRRFQLPEKPRRLLVGGMRGGGQMLISTPLLKWYLEHGMVVTKIYQVVEFTPHRCFRNVVKEVSDGRSLGDSDPNKAIIADTKNVEGNSGYGGTIMDQEKFQSVTYVQGTGRVMTEANKPQFKNLPRRIFRGGKGQEKTGHQSTHPDRVLHLAVREITHAPVLLRLPGRLRRQRRFCVL